MAVPSVLIPDDAACRAHRAKHGHAADCSHLPRQRVYLGRRRPKLVRQQLRFRDYRMFRATTSPPATLDYYTKALASLARMYLNDREGDCVIAGKAHALGVWSGNDSDSGGVVLATDAEIEQQYQSICGPGDNGCVITDVLDAMKSKGFLAGGNRYPIDGYVSVDWTNKNEVMVALYLFGALTIGINLPEAWTEGGDGSTWNVTNTGIVGGHDVTCVGYDANGVWIATWGGKRLIAWAAFTSRQWIEECYAPLAPIWYGNDKLAPCGVDAAALAADLATLGGGSIPPIDPTPVPVVPPVVVPPVPVVPPAPSQVAQVAPQTVSVSGHVPMFGGNVTLTGTVAGQNAPVVPAKAGGRVGDFLTIINDARVAIGDLTSLVALAEVPTTTVADLEAEINQFKQDALHLVADIEGTARANDTALPGLGNDAFFEMRARYHVAKSLLNGSFGVIAAMRGAAMCNSDFINQQIAALAPEHQAAVAALAQQLITTPSGGIIAIIEAFFASAAGQALLSAIIAAVIAMLTGGLGAEKAVSAATLFQIAMDAVMLYSAYKSGNAAAIQAALQQLLNDIGIG